MAGLFNGHLLEFPRIRVDSFTPPPPAHRPPWTLPDPNDPSAPRTRAPNAQYYLLTHVHSDHLIGLTNDFTGNIICSPDTKRMLLRLESEKDRDHIHNGIREVKRRKYEGLAARHQIIETLNPGETKVVCIPEAVSITLLDANHCPGSSMFLVQSSTKAILHTGDVRADVTFRRALRRSPQLQAFFPPSFAPATPSTLSATRQLDRIYLDTSAFMGTGDMPEKESVLEALVTQMSLYPEDTIFFLNAWCFGWEDVVKEVARHFSQPVHADRYKRSIYGAVQSDPFMLGCTTDDPAATRFHACDRYNRCEVARNKAVVQVVMVEVKSAAWELQHQQFLNTLNNAAVGESDWPMTIEVPIARHSPLPELQELVKMFKPTAVSPNTLIPHYHGLDFFVFADLLKTAIGSETYDKMIAERDHYFTVAPRFGCAWLSQARAVHSQLSALVLAGSQGQDLMTVPQYLAGGLQGPQSDNRRAWGLDQVMRIAGWGFEGSDARRWGGFEGDGAGAAFPFSSYAPRPHIKTRRQESFKRPLRTSPSSSPTLPSISTSVIKETGWPFTSSPPTSVKSDIPPTIASTSSSSAEPNSGTSRQPNPPGPSFMSVAHTELKASTEVSESKIVGRSDALPPPMQPRCPIKLEPSQAIKAEPSEPIPRRRGRSLKRERRESSYRVNIAHLSDLASSQ